MVRWLIGLALLPALAVAAPPRTGAEWLQAIERRAAALDDVRMTLGLRLVSKAGAETRRELVILQRGDRRLVRVTSPARLAGVTLLSTGDGMHLYLPAFRRTRRIDGRARGDRFAGTDFTLDDLTRRRFAAEYTASVESTGEEGVVLLLTPRDSAAHEHVRLKLTAATSDARLLRLEALDAGGQPLRRVIFSDYRQVDGQPFAHRLEVRDERRGRRTEASVSGIEVRAGLSERLFAPSRLGSR
jgi:outer membrane lipoprotein-sorting protein